MKSWGIVKHEHASERYRHHVTALGVSYWWVAFTATRWEQCLKSMRTSDRTFNLTISHWLLTSLI